MRILNIFHAVRRWLFELAAFFVLVLAFGFLALVIHPSIAVAAGTTAQLSWVMPTSYTDETPLPAADIAETVIEWRRTAAGPVLGTVRVPAPATVTTVPGLTC